MTVWKSGCPVHGRQINTWLAINLQSKRLIRANLRDPPSLRLQTQDYITSVLVANQTVGFGRNKGSFDMFECPDFFPIGPVDPPPMPAPLLCVRGAR